MFSFLKHLSATYSRLGIQATDRLLVACSGGMDSTALLHATLKLTEFDSRNLIIGHFNHGLRGEESDADESFVTELSRCFGCRLASQKATFQGKNEEQLRQLRYDFLRSTAAQFECTTVVLAHHADDQAETILHNIARGTGWRGLGGIHEMREMDELRFVRPLLQLTRKQIAEFTAEHDIPFRTDTSNSSLLFTRNIIRQQTLPHLTEAINTATPQHLVCLGQEATELLNYLDQVASSLLQNAMIEQQPLSCRLKIPQLRQHAPVILRHAFRLLWDRQNWPLQKMSTEHWHNLVDAVHHESRRDLPTGVTVVSDQQLLRLLRRARST